jgi:hypothetical protein
MRTLLLNARIFDGVIDRLSEPKSVLIGDDRIVAILPADERPESVSRSSRSFRPLMSGRQARAYSKVPCAADSPRSATSVAPTTVCG